MRRYSVLRLAILNPEVENTYIKFPAFPGPLQDLYIEDTESDAFYVSVQSKLRAAGFPKEAASFVSHLFREVLGAEWAVPEPADVANDWAQQYGHPVEIGALPDTEGAASVTTVYFTGIRPCFK